MIHLNASIKENEMILNVFNFENVIMYWNIRKKFHVFINHISIFVDFYQKFKNLRYYILCLLRCSVVNNKKASEAWMQLPSAYDSYECIYKRKGIDLKRV